MRPLAFVLLAPLVCSSVAPAAAQWPPEKFENLKVLPDTIPPRQLIGLMADFTRALGVRCTHCHVGEEGRPLATYDFPSDDRLAKRKARGMLRMVMAINGQDLADLEERADPPVRVQCVTCHAGRTTPRQLEDVLVLAYAAGGLDSTRAAYATLRERYYGRAAYDFGSVPLTVVADSIRNRGSLADAVAMQALNVEMNPTSVFAKRQHGHDAVLLAFRTQGVDAGVTRYHALRDTYGADGFPEPALNDLGYALLRGGNVAEATAAFALAVEAFPQSANAYDSLGEAYVAAGDTAKAIANYRRSLELNPRNANAEKVLRDLGARR
jgi:tetratricopeptide (TPR) repeat protein